MKTFGLCMDGNEEVFEEVVRRTYGSGVVGTHFRYIEVGVAAGETMAAVGDIVHDLETELMGIGVGPRPWVMLGVDVEGGWSLSVEGWVANMQGMFTKRGLPNDVLGFAGSNKVRRSDCGVMAMAAMTLDPLWWTKHEVDGVSVKPGTIDMVFIDGCHGEKCVRQDFFKVMPLVRKGGMVVFHDASPQCQGIHHQPHCGTGIAVRSALERLGLLKDEVPGWRRFCETTAHHGIFVVEKG